MPLQQHHPFSRIEIPGNNHPFTGIEIFATIIHLQGFKALAIIIPLQGLKSLAIIIPLQGLKSLATISAVPTALCSPWRANFYILTAYCILPTALCPMLSALCLFVTIRTPLHNLLLHRILRSKPGQVIATQWIISRANKTFVAVTAWPVRR